jgi:hypothetical protein
MEGTRKAGSGSVGQYGGGGLRIGGGRVLVGPMPAWYWRRFPILILKPSKQLVLKISNVNSEFHPSISTSKPYHSDNNVVIFSRQLSQPTLLSYKHRLGKEPYTVREKD